MSDVLIRGARLILTMDDERRELAGADLRLRGGIVAEIGTGLPPEGAEVVDAGGCGGQRRWPWFAGCFPCT